MRLLNAGKTSKAEVLDYKEDKGLTVVRYRCPYCRFSHSIIERGSPPFYRTCGKCKGKLVIHKPRE